MLGGGLPASSGASQHVPDLILIDGGQGQVEKAREALEEFQLAHLPLVGVSKGRDRRAGEEKLVFPGEVVGADPAAGFARACC